jgi:DNA-directed RNA polymerase, mitochondrial
MPAFYHVFRNYGYLIKQEVKPHPILARLYRESVPINLVMETSLIPSYSPPLPWINYHHGGYIITKTPIMRYRHS